MRDGKHRSCWPTPVCNESEPNSIKSIDEPGKQVRGLTGRLLGRRDSALLERAAVRAPAGRVHRRGHAREPRRHEYVPHGAMGHSAW